MKPEVKTLLESIFDTHSKNSTVRVCKMRFRDGQLKETAIFALIREFSDFEPEISLKPKARPTDA